MSESTANSFPPAKLFAQAQQLLQDKQTFTEHCILNQTLALLADKWTLLVLMALMQGPKRPTDLRQQIPSISPKMLTYTLKTLLNYGMVDRVSFPEIPPRVEYTLTPFGQSTADPLGALFEWSIKWADQLQGLYKEPTILADDLGEVSQTSNT